MVTNRRRCFGGSKSVLFVCLLLNAFMVFTVAAEGVEADSLNFDLIQLQPISPVEGSYVIITKQMVQVVLNDSSPCLDCIILPGNSTANVARFVNISDSLDSNIDQFTYAELINSEVALIVDLLGGLLEYTQPVKVTQDGDTFVKSALNISIIPISISASFQNLTDSICYQKLDLQSDHSIQLSRQSIKVDTNQPQRLPEMTVELLEQPLHGVLQYGDDHTPLPASFSYTLFLEQQISYTIIDPKIQNYSDHFSIQLSIGHGISEVVTITLCIDPLPYPMLTHLGNISVYVTGQKPLSSDFLKATQTRLLDTNPQDLIYHIIATPSFGVILRDHMLMSVSSLHNFTQEEVNEGKIVYINKQASTKGDMMDSFQFRLLNKYYEPENTYTALITLMENRLEVTNTGITVDEGGNHTFTVNEFYVDVPDGYELRPIYILDYPKFGGLILKRPDPEPEISIALQFFSLSDIEGGYLHYKQNSDEEEIMDMITILLVAAKEDHKSLDMSVSINISITPTNDQAPSVLVNHAIYLVEGTSVPITVNNLEYGDEDYGYNNEDLIYSMTWPFFNGEICLNGSCSPGYIGFQWKQSDMHGNLVYKHTSGMGTNEYLLFDVYDYLDGHKTSDLLIFNILPLVPDRSGDGTVHVTEGKSVVINSSSMNFVSNDVLPIEFKYSVTKGPTKGTLRRVGSSESLTDFTQVDINNGSIVYHHDDSNSDADSFTFRLNVRTYSGEYTVNIDIKQIDDDPPRLAINDAIFVDFTKSVHLNRTQLQIRDADTKQTDQLQYEIVTTTQYGVIEKRPDMNTNTYTETTMFTQKDINDENVRYRHTHPHTHIQQGPFMDSFTFNITDGINTAGLYTAPIYILPQTVPFKVIGPSVLEGGSIILSRESIEIYHPYFAGTNGEVSILKKPSKGFLRINGEVCEVCDFNMEDLAEEEIEYVHSGGEDNTDAFNFFINWPGLLRTDYVNYTIHVLPVNDQSPHIITSPHLDLWASEIITLSQSLLLTRDPDSSASDLRYQFNLTPEQRDDGHFSPTGKPKEEILTFTQKDINDGSVIYVDTHTYDDLLSRLKYTVTDGLFTVHGEFNVTARLVILQEVANAHLNIKMAENVNITNKQLNYITNNPEINRSMIVYHINRNFIYGHIVGPQGVARHNFTQSEVDSGQLMYVHTGIDIWEPLDMANVTVSAPLATDVFINISIDIELLNESDPLAVNVPLNINEGGMVCFDQHNLDGRNIRYNTWKSNPGNSTFEETMLTYNVTTPPAHGSLMLEGYQVSDFLHSNLTSGLLCYHNDGSEFDKDSVSFDVVIVSPYGEIGRVSDVLKVNITLVNDEVPVLTTPTPHLTLTHTFWFQLTQEKLNVIDEDNTPEEITFIVDTQSLHQADLLLRLRNTTDVSEFSQADINKGHLTILPNKTGNTSFTLEFNDGKHAIQSVTIQLSVNKHTLEFLVENPTLRLLQTDQQVVINTDVAESSTNGPRQLTKYNIIKRPSHGRVLVNGVETDVFTQLDVDNKHVCYKLKDSIDGTRDQFEMVVSNKQAKKTTFNVSIAIGASGEFKDVFLPPAMYAQLSADMMILQDLPAAHRDIKIEVTSRMTYGVLYRKYPNTDTGSKEVTLFDYSELRSGYIYYKWTPSDEIVAGQNYTENVTGIVRVESLVPGEFSLTLILEAPPEAVTSVPMVTATDTTSQPSQTEPISTPQDQSSNNKSQFNLALYVPLIGLIIVVVIAFIVVVGFCCSQSRHIKKKLYHKSSKIDFQKTPPIQQKPTSFRQSPTRLPHSPQLTGGFDQEYSDSESSSPDVMMTQTQQPMTTISASHTYLPHSQSSFEPSSSGYHTHATPQLGGSPTFMRHQESPVVSMTSNYPPNPSYAAFTRNELRSSSPVRKVNGTRRNTRPYASMTISSGRGKSSPTRSREYASPLHRAHHVHDSTSSLGYDTSSMTQESLRIPTVTTPAPVNLDSLINQENISDLYKRTHPLLKPSQHWV